MRLKMEQLETRRLLTGDVQVVHDPVTPSQPGDEVTRTIRVFADEFDGKVRVQSSLTDELDNVRWQRTDGFAKQVLPNPFLGQEPDFQISAGRTDDWRASVDTTGEPLGDVNGDGETDLLFYAAPSKRGEPREPVVVFGPLNSDLDLQQLASDGSQGLLLNPGDLHPLGDINGDGFDDMLQGKQIIFGGARLHVWTHVLSLEDADQLHPVGDINGDGFNDLLATGSDSYLVFGRADFGQLSTATFDSLAADSPGVLRLGESIDAANPAGDLNHDGIGDVLFGRLGTMHVGWQPFVLYGNVDLPSHQIDFDALDGAQGFSLGNPLGVSLTEWYSYESNMTWRVSGTSDVNGDAIDDLTIAFSGGGDCFGCTATDRSNIDVDAGVLVLHGGSEIAPDGQFRPERDSHGVIRLATPYSFFNGQRLNAHVLDMNDDGLTDIQVTAGGRNWIRNYIISGDSEPLDVDLSHVFYPFDGFDGQNGHQHEGDLRFIDVNGDGLEDALLEVLIDQPSRSDGGPDHRIDVFLAEPTEPVQPVIGSGNIDDVLTFAGSESVIYEVSGTVKEAARSLTTTATPIDGPDADIRNNVVSDRTGVQLDIHTAGPIVDGDSVELTVSVTNDGPTNAREVQVLESVTESLDLVTWTRSTQLFPATISLPDLPSGLGATLEAPDFVRLHERCGCPEEELNKYSAQKIYDQLGRRAGSLGDVNGDGFDDIFLSDEDLTHPVKRAWQFNGRADFGSNGIFPNRSRQVAPPDQTPAAVDVNQDGFVDQLVISADAQAVHVLFGDASGAFPNPSELNGANGFSITGITPETHVSSVVAGDINGDGYDDIILAEERERRVVSDPKIHVAYGVPSAPSGELDLSGLDGSNGFHIEPQVPDSGFGTQPTQISIASDFDVNGDGVDDILIGSPTTGPSTDTFYTDGTRTGEAYLIFGRSAADVSGTGAISDTVDVPVGAEVVYTIRGMLPDEPTATVSGTVEVHAAADQVDLDKNTNIVQVGNAALVADIDGNQRVDFADFLILSASYGRTDDVQRTDGDLNGDSMVDFADFLILSQFFAASW